MLIKDDICVVFTTHSPTTAALVDEGAIIALEKFSSPSQVSRRHAVNLLLGGQERVFVDLTGTRLVFVEDGSDAHILEQIYSHIRDQIDGVELVFRSLARKEKSGTEDGGKETVRKAINEIGDERNIFGLIEFDGQEASKENLHVLCEGERYSIENLLLDPRIVVHILLRANAKEWSEKLQLKAVYTSASSLSEEETQVAIQTLDQIVFENAEAKTRGIEYLDGMNLLVSEAWLLSKGHDLETKIRSQLQDFCTQVKKGASGLQFISDQILLEVPGLLASSAKVTFQKLAASP